MGRLRRLASLVKVAVIGVVAIVPMISRTPVPELPQSITSAGSWNPPTPTPPTVQALAMSRDRRAEGPHRLGRVQHVPAFQEAGDPRLAHRHRPEDQGAVRDRLVARHFRHAPRKGPDLRDFIGCAVP